MIVVRRIVSNTGPLISLANLWQGSDFIRQLYDTIIIPPGVLDEVAEGQFATPHAYLQHYGIVDLLEVQAVSRSEQLPEAARLHSGEAQAIQLARELALPLLIEETVGRRVARGLGISISGIAGQILKAFRQGSLTAQEARDKLLELLQAGRINRQIYEALLAAIP
jgi:predicted nucleic acid-binding protein